MVNDAVAIILFKVVGKNHHNSGDIADQISTAESDMTAGDITIEIIGKLLLTVFASLGIGAGCGINILIKPSFAPFCSKTSDFLSEVK